ncbi:hypothetical protein BD770DRAFT_387409 [Pilaira anomala]|nr:hypothetical protein BD770DRAFT_387409 [Pilaira anomala]
MANKSNAKRNTQVSDVKERKTTAYDDIESLQITFYEIESWIEKTRPLLSRMTKELEKASGHFDNSKRKKVTLSKEVVDQKKLEQQLLQLQQQQLLWKRSILCDEASTSSTAASTDRKENKSMQWILSFQPGNLLRLDTNITSVEQLIEAVQKIRLLQQEGEHEPNSHNNNKNQSTVENEEEVDLIETQCTSPALSNTSQPDVSYVEYWFNAIGRRPKICLENYKHCRMNLNGLTKNISPQALNYIGQVTWDCLHPRCCLDWTSFLERTGDAERSQVCIDSGLAVMFLHVMRHDKDICDNAEQIAGFYYDRARESLMEFFDDHPDCATIEALLNLSIFCIICKRYSQARIYIGLALHMILDCGIHKPEENVPAENLLRKRKFYKLLLVLYSSDYNLSIYTGDPTLIMGTEINIDFYKLITINEKLLELNKTATINNQVDFDNNKTIVKELYFVFTVELGKISANINTLIDRGASKKQLLTQEKFLTQWRLGLPEKFKTENHDFNHYEQVRREKEMATIKDITSVVNAETLEAHASLILKIQYETQWIILHKAVLQSIRNSSPTPTQLEEETRSSNICANSADTVVEMAETVSRCFGWCVCQQFVTCVYHASTVYCGQALVKNNIDLRNKAKEMILRIMRILDAGGANHEGFPDDMAECLCEFLTNHGMHNDNVECSCSVIDDIPTISSTGIIPALGPLNGMGMINNTNSLLLPTHKHLKKLNHVSRMVIDDNSSPSPLSQ